VYIYDSCMCYLIVAVFHSFADTINNVHVHTINVIYIKCAWCSMMFTFTQTQCFFSLHGISMLKGLYFTAVVFFCFSAPNLLRSLNGSQPNLETYSLMTTFWKIWSKLPRAFTPQDCFFGTDFELWPNISLQRNVISKIGKKRQSTRTPQRASKFGELWSRNGWERLASFCQPP